MKSFDPRNPETPFPGLGLLDIAQLCKHIASIGEADRSSVVVVARQAEAWQRRSARIALAGAEVSKALADLVNAAGSPTYPQAVHQLGWAIGDYLVAQTER